MEDLHQTKTGAFEEATRTADVPLLQYTDTTVGVPVAKATQRRHHKRQPEDYKNPDGQDAECHQGESQRSQKNEDQALLA